MASFTISAVSSILSESSMPLTILSDGKVFEVFRYALNRQGFLIKGLVPWLLHYALCSMPPVPCSMGYAFFTVLPDPSGIPVAGRAKKDVLRELAK